MGRRWREWGLMTAQPLGSVAPKKPRLSGSEWQKRKNAARASRRVRGGPRMRKQGPKGQHRHGGGGVVLTEGGDVRGPGNQ